MVVLDDEFSVGATLAEDGAGTWPSPKSTATASPCDFRIIGGAAMTMAYRRDL